MNKSLVYTYGLLILMTVMTAVISNVFVGTNFAVILILGISFLKFGLVAFQFMELKKANIFWKTSVLATVGLLVLLLILLK